MGRWLDLAAFLTLAAANGSAVGQESVSFSWQIQDVAGSGQTNSNGVVDPGEDALISLSLSFRPAIGGHAIWDTNGGTGQVGAVAGFGYVNFDLVSGANLNTGTWSSPVFASGFNVGQYPNIDPQNGLFGIGFGQFPLPGQVPDPRNDSWFFRTRWHPLSYTAREVQFSFRLNQAGPGLPTVYLDVGDRDPQQNIVYRRDSWSSDAPAGEFSIAPAPGTFILLILAATPLARRRLE